MNIKYVLPSNSVITLLNLNRFNVLSTGLVQRSKIMLCLACILLSLSMISEGQAQDKTNEKRKDLSSDLSLFHKGDTYQLHLLRKASVAFQIWHQFEASPPYLQSQFTELGTPAGGCRVRLFWSDETLNLRMTPPQIDSKKITKTLLKKLLSHKGLTHKEKVDPRATAVSFEISSDRTITLNKVLSAGCPLSAPTISPKTKKYTSKKAISKNLLNHSSSKDSNSQGVKWLTLTNDPQPVKHSSKLPSKRPAHLPSKFVSLKRLLFSHEGVIIQITPQAQTRFKRTQDQRIYMVAPKGKPVQIKVSLLNGHPPLTPFTLPQLSNKLKPLKEFAHWKTLLKFLSYQEGIYAGLGEGISQRDAHSLLGVLLLSDVMSADWIEAALSSALQEAKLFPTSYQSPLHHLDPRLLLPSVLATYLLDHPEGKIRGEAFLRQRFQQRLLGSFMTLPTRSLMRHAVYFVNRPAERFLMGWIEPKDQVENSSQEVNLQMLNNKPNKHQRRSLLLQKKPPLISKEYHFTENVVLTPFALKSTARLLKHSTFGPLLGARPGESKRAYQLAKKWKKARSFFGRKIEVYEGRRRTQAWANFLGVPDGKYLSNSLIADFSAPIDHISTQSAKNSALLGLDVLFNFQSKLELTQILDMMKPFPVGLLDEDGLIEESDLIYRSELSEYPPVISRYPLWLEVVWMKALSRQLKRKWPAKITFLIEDIRQALWTRIVKHGGLEGLRVKRWSLSPSSSPSPSPTPSPSPKPYSTSSPAPSPTPSPTSSPRSPARKARTLKPSSSELSIADYRGWDLRTCSALTLEAPPAIKAPSKIKASELR